MTRLRFGWLACILFLVTSSMAGQQRSPVVSDPADLQMQLRSATGSNNFQIGEIIPIEVSLASTAPNRYLEPCALFRETHFGYPMCRFSTQSSFAITPETGWVDYTRDTHGRIQTGNGATFPVPNPTLTSQPFTAPYTLTRRFRFDKPGEYKVRLTMEVGLNDATTELSNDPNRLQNEHFATVTSELDLQIVPADAAWQKEIVRKGTEAFAEDAPQQTNPPSKEALEYQHNKDALCALGTPEAARVLAHALLTDSSTEICLERSPSLSDGVAEMQRLLAGPDTAVNAVFFSKLAGLLNLEKSDSTYPTQEITDKERALLFSALPHKRGDAQISSLATVLQFPPQAAPRTMTRNYVAPFPDPVIALAAANFDQLPPELQRTLLEENWDSINSPLMLATVRRRAENGDGPALLHWLKLEPPAATAFVRKEIVRVQPRFSAYYLRLPDASLPTAQQDLIAINFVGLSIARPNNDLVHSATLLHRYTTRAVLPKVMAMIDENLVQWPCSVQLPVLAFLLKVSPQDAAPRVTTVLESDKTQICTGRLLDSLGMLQPGPVLEKLAMTQVDMDGPDAIDGVLYLQNYAPPELKSKVFSQLKIWNQRFIASGAGKRIHDGVGAAHDIDIQQLVQALARAFVSAQGWVVTPNDEAQLRSSLGDETVKQLQCGSGCDESLSITADSKRYYIDGQENAAWEQKENADQSMEYLNPKERLQYSIVQYRCADLQALKEKLRQFPAGSTFFFADFSARDRTELVEINDFLKAHHYNVGNAQEFLAQAQPAR